MHATVLAAGFALVWISSTGVEAASVSFSAGGDDTTASIQTIVDRFRNALGNTHNGYLASSAAIPGGRRDIHWEGLGARTGTAGEMPFNVFLDNRGARVNTPGTGFLQTPVTNTLLTSINPTYATTFAAFSTIRISTPTDSHISDGFFFLPGTLGAVGATVGGFGVIFSEVDLSHTTQLRFFGGNHTQPFSAFVTPGTGANASLSFLGEVGNAGEPIARVRITTGNSALGFNETTNVDVVVMDEFLTGEPLPEPGSLTLSGLGMVGILVLGFWRKHFRHRWAG